MSKEYTEMVENNYPVSMKKQWQDYVKHLEREMKKSFVKIAELEVKERRQKLEEVIHDKLHSR